MILTYSDPLTLVDADDTIGMSDNVFAFVEFESDASVQAAISTKVGFCESDQLIMNRTNHS